MRSDVIASRPSSIKNSIISSMEEVNLMRAGKLEKPTLEELFAIMEKWVKEESQEE